MHAPELRPPPPVSTPPAAHCHRIDNDIVDNSVALLYGP